MARDNKRFKRLVNRLAEHLEQMQVGDELGSEGELAKLLDASRTTVRAVLAHLSERGVLSWEGRRKLLMRAPQACDLFPERETLSHQDLVEGLFLEWVLQSDLPPGTAFHEAELARRFDAPVAALREYLIRFEPFGLIEKHANRHWVLKGFTRAFAEEMWVVREMFERRALGGLVEQAALAGPLRLSLQKLEAEHRALLASPDRDLMAFPALDARFHQLLCGAAENRFITDFSRTISIIVHFHYRWNKRDELRRNRAALLEHIDLIEAVLAQDLDGARRALDLHLATARQTLMESVQWADGS